jgi:hypothetical protein
MTHPASNSASRNARRIRTLHVATVAAALLTALVLTLAAMPARAADGCQVLLCLAAPSWRDIPQCVPPVQQVFRDTARGKPFPVCRMSGAGNSANHEWASAPSFYPPQYTQVIDGAGAPIHRCDYVGAISVWINGLLFSRTWLAPGGDSVTDFSAAAKAQLGSWDTRFDDEHARWLALQPPAPSAHLR